MKTQIAAIAALTLAGSTGFAAAQCGSSSAKNEHHVEVRAASYEHVASNTIVDIAAADARFTTLVAAVKAADLVDVLSGEGPFTVFAPTNGAFDKLPDGTIATLLKPENKGTLQSILTYHVVGGSTLASDVVDLDTVTTVQGQRADIKVRDGKVFIDGAQIIITDIEASNGVIHVIDTVILPEQKNIAEVAEEAGSFGTLLAAAKAAGLVPALTGGDEYTVFAPTDEAFAALGSDTIKTLLKPENQHKLKDILLYHVVPGRVYADQALAAKNAETAQGGSVKIAKKYGQARVNDAKLLTTDIEASNGVIHVIDSVLMPQ